jgi:HK97 family phage major capsid protein
MDNEKVGNRNNRNDQQRLQNIHDFAVENGAKCADGKALSMEMTVREIHNQIYKLINPNPTMNDSNKWIEEIFDDYVIVHEGEKYYKYTWSWVNGKIALGQPVEAKKDWEAVEKSLYFGNHLKSISKTNDELTVGNYIVLFGGRDLTGVAYGKNKDGSSGEFFSEKTMLESDYTKSGLLHVDFEHGRDPDNVGIGKDDVLGRVDWSSAKADARGIFVKRILNRRNKFVKWLEPLIEEGLISNSSECIPEQMQKANNGEIINWPLRRDTLTVTPMEPRMLSANALTALKALSDEFPEYKSLLTSDQAALPIEDDTNKTKQGVIKMSDQTVDIAKEVAAAVKTIRDAELAELATKAAQQKAIDEAKAEGAKEAVEELKKKGALKASEYHTTEHTNDSDEGVGAFKSWMQTGQVNRELIEPDSSYLNIKTSGVFNVTTGDEGGYMVPDPLYDKIIAKRDLASWVRQAPCQYFTTDSDHLLIPYEDTRHADFVSTAEKATYANDTTGNVGQLNLALTKYTKEIKATEEFLSAKNSNWESWMAGVLGRAAARTENTVATAAIVADATAGTVFAITAVITAAELARCIGELSNGYAVTGEAGFLMKNGVKWYCKGISGNNFSFMNTPAGGDFFGFPCYVSDSMAENTTGLTPVIFANYQYFAVLEKPGMLVQRNPYLHMDIGEVSIFANIYRAYDVLQAEAIRKYNSVS